jgi:hypothetical protein
MNDEMASLKIRVVHRANLKVTSHSTIAVLLAVGRGWLQHGSVREMNFQRRVADTGSAFALSFGATWCICQSPK